MGGGTSIVEALVLGRVAVGVDVNPVACVITRAKTTPLSPADKEALVSWSRDRQLLSALSRVELLPDRRLRNVPPIVWRAVLPMVLSLERLRFRRRKDFARCAVLRVAQWALESRHVSDDPDTIWNKLGSLVEIMVEDNDGLIASGSTFAVSKRQMVNRRFLYQGDVVAACNDESFFSRFGRPKLVLTSPPYPGVHVLYHRLQVGGRRETPLPFWIAGVEDGHGPAHYTMGGRTASGLRSYYSRITGAYVAMKRLMDPRGVVVQLVGFSDPESQLSMYLNAMESAGFVEIGQSHGDQGSRLVRNVPNRKWYTQAGVSDYESQETLLIHRPA
jgi:hypothetical protein